MTAGISPIRVKAAGDATSFSWPIVDLKEVCHTSATLSSLLSTEVVKTDATSSSFSAVGQATQLLKPVAAPAYSDVPPLSEKTLIDFPEHPEPPIQ